MADFNDLEELNGLEDEFGTVFQKSMETMDQYNSRLNQKKRRQLEADHEAQMENLEEILETMGEIFEEVEESLSDVDKQLYQTLLLNRQKDMKKLERDYKRRHRQLSDSQKSFFEDFEERLDEVTNRLSKIASISTALDVADLKSAVEDSAMSNIEMRRNLKVFLGWSEDEYAAFAERLSDTTRELNKEFGNIFNSSEIIENAHSLATELGVVDEEMLLTMSKGLSMFEKATKIQGTEAYDSVFRLASAFEESTEPIVQRFNDLAIMGNRLGYSTDPQAYVDAMNLVGDTISRNAKSAEDAQRGMENTARTVTMLEDSYVNSAAWFEELKSFETLSPDKIEDLNERWGMALNAAGLSLTDAQAMVKNFDYDDLTVALFEGMKKAVDSGADSQMFEDIMKEQFGLDSKDYGNLMKNMESDPQYFSNMSKELETAYDQVLSKGSETAKALEDIHVSWIDRIKNAFTSSKVGEGLTDTLDNLDMSLVDVWAGLEIIKGAGGLLLSGGKGLLSKIFGKSGSADDAAKGLGGLISKIFGKSGSADDAAKVVTSSMDDVAKGGGLFSKILKTGGKAVTSFGDEVAKSGGWFSKALKAGGKAITTFGDDAAKLGAKGILKTAGSALGKVAPFLSVFDFIVDGFGGAKKSKEWFGEDATGMQKVSSVVGAALGGTGPGLFDEGTIGQKAWSLGGGTLKGAGAGAAIGSVVPLIGTTVGAGVGAALGLAGSAVGGENLSKIVENIMGANLLSHPKKWFGEDAGSQQVLATAVGGTLGTVGPGLFDKDASFKDKILSIVAGSVKGATVGALNPVMAPVGAAVGGISAAIGGENIAKATDAVFTKIQDLTEGAIDKISQFGRLGEFVGDDWELTRKTIKSINEVWADSDSNVFQKIGGTASELFEGVTYKMELVSDLWKDITEGVSEFVDKYRAKVVETWTSAKTNITKTWNNIKKVATKVWGTIETVGEGIWSAVKEAASIIWTPIKDTATGVWTVIEDTATGVWTVIEDTATGVWTVIEDTATGVWTVIKDTAVGIWTPIKDTATGAWKIIQETGVGVGSAVKEAAVAIWTPIKTAAMEVWGPVKNAASVIWSDIQEVASVIWKDVKESASVIWSGVEEVASVIWKDVKVVAEAIWDPIKTTASDIWTDVKTSASIIWSDVKEAASGIWTPVKTTASDIWTDVKTSASIIWSDVKEAASGIWSDVKVSAGSIWDYVKEAASIIWTPIKETASGIWSVVQESASEIWTPIKDSVLDIWSEVNESAIRIWSPIKDSAIEIWSAVKEAASIIWTPIKDTATGVWTHIKGSAEQVWGDVKETAVAVWMPVKEAASNIWTDVKTTASDIWEDVKKTASNIWTDVKTTASAIWTPIKEEAQSIWGGVKTTASVIWTDVKTTASVIWTDVKTTASAIWTDVKTTASDIWSGVKDTASAIWEDVKTVASNIWTPVQEEAIAVWSDVRDVASEIWTPIQKSGQLIWSSVKDTASEIWSPIEEKAKEIWSPIKQQGVEIWSFVKGSAQNIWTDVKTTASSIWTPIKDAANTIWSPIKTSGQNIWSAVKTSATSIWSSVKEAGVNIWTPVKNAAKGIWDELSEGVDKLVTAGSDLLGITGGLLSKIFGDSGDDVDRKTLGEWFTGLFDGSHEDGLWKVPKDNYRAILHKDEAVLTAEDAEDWRSDIKKRQPMSYIKQLMAGVSDAISTADSLYQKLVNGSDGTDTGTAGNVSTQDGSSIWRSLLGLGYSKWGAAGLMGNLFAESGLRANNLQNSYERSLGHSDESYTKAVDNGSYKNFARDKAGYGLAQWTFWSRKQNLLDFVKSKNSSIGNAATQTEFLGQELANSYKSVDKALKSAKSVREASNVVLFDFERPKDQGPRVQDKRAEYGIAYYEKYARMDDEEFANIAGLRRYETGTRYVPSTQIALVHQGEKITPAREVEQTSSVVATGNNDIIQVLKWGFEFLGKKIEQSQSAPAQQGGEERRRKESKTVAAFDLGGILV